MCINSNPFKIATVYFLQDVPYLTFMSFFLPSFLPFFLSLNLPYLHDMTAFDSDVVEIAKNDTQDFLGVLDEILKAATRNYFTTTASGAQKI